MGAGAAYVAGMNSLPVVPAGPGLASVALDAHEVAPNLWVGSQPPKSPLVEQHGFKLLVLCAQEYQPRSKEFGFRGPDIVVAHAPFDDSHRFTGLMRDTAVAAGRDVAHQLAGGKKVLVTCHAGINRSALVAGIAMLRLYPKMTADRVVGMIRARRMRQCLSNGVFVQFLYELERVRR